MEIETLGISFDDHPLAGAWSHIRRLSAVSLSKIEDFAGCGAITVLVRVEGTLQSLRGANTFVKISDASAVLECATEHMRTTGDVFVVELTRNTTEARVGSAPGRER